MFVSDVYVGFETQGRATVEMQLQRRVGMRSRVDGEVAQSVRALSVVWELVLDVRFAEGGHLDSWICQLIKQ